MLRDDVASAAGIKLMTNVSHCSFRVLGLPKLMENPGPKLTEKPVDEYWGNDATLTHLVCGNVRRLGPYNLAGSGIDLLDIALVPRYCCLGEVYHAFTCWADLVSRQRWMGSVASSHMMQSWLLPAWSDVAFGTHRTLSRCSDAIVLFWVYQLTRSFPRVTVLFQVIVAIVLTLR